MNDKPDQSFDSILSKFDNNIYGTSKGKLRHQLLLHYLQKYLPSVKPSTNQASAHACDPITRQSLNDPITRQSLNILDAGAGTGVMTQTLLSLGHNVTFNDISEQAVNDAKLRFAGSQNIQYIQGSLSNVDSHLLYDVIICHAVLEWLQDPFTCLTQLTGHLKPGGILSVSFFNLHAHRFGNILYGNFDYVKAGMPRKNTVRLNPNNALDPFKLIEHLQSLPLEICHTAGLRCFHDYLKDREKQQSEYDALKALELEYGNQEPYKWLGKYFHIIARRKIS